jgi:hypothetical protein
MQASGDHRGAHQAARQPPRYCCTEGKNICLHCGEQVTSIQGCHGEGAREARGRENHGLGELICIEVKREGHEQEGLQVVVSMVDGMRARAGRGGTCHGRSGRGSQGEHAHGWLGGGRRKMGDGRALGDMGRARLGQDAADGRWSS